MPTEQDRNIELRLARFEIVSQLFDALRNSMTYRSYCEAMAAWNRELDQDPELSAEERSGEVDWRRGSLADSPLGDWTDSPMLVKAAPGLGKTHHTVQIAAALWEQLPDDDIGRVPILHIGPTHKSFDNVGRQPYWGHWQGHDNGSESGEPCPKYIAFSKGYTSEELECSVTCRAERPAPDSPLTPTFAPVEYVLASEPDVLPLRPAALDYGLWVFDDIGIDRFVDTMVVTRRDVDLTALHHPYQSVKKLAKALLVIMDDHKAANAGRGRFDFLAWAGKDFYDRLESEFQAQGTTTEGWLAEWQQEFENIEWPRESWVEGSDDGAPGTWPCNFGLRLAAFINLEGRDFLADAGRNPHVHVVHDRPNDGISRPPGVRLPPKQSIIRIRSRKYIPRSAVPKTVWLDATGDPVLLSRIFGRPIAQQETLDLEFPATMRVYQCWGTHVGVTTAEHFDGDGRSVIALKYRRMLKAELAHRKAAGLARKVGIITFKSLVPDAIKALQELGYRYSDDEWETEVVAGWYYNQRGANDFKSCDVLLLMGYPSPNPQGLYEEACALFDDGELIDTDRENYTASIQLRNPLSRIRTLLTVDVTKPLFGYKDERIHGLLLNKSRSELYQAFHRARPLAETSVSEVLVFSDVPILGVPVDGFLGREGKVLDTLRSLLATAPESSDLLQVVEKDRLVDEIMARFPGLWPTRCALDRWVRRASGWLRAATGTQYRRGEFRLRRLLDGSPCRRG